MFAAFCIHTFSFLSGRKYMYFITLIFLRQISVSTPRTEFSLKTYSKMQYRFYFKIGIAFYFLL